MPFYFSAAIIISKPRKCASEKFPCARAREREREPSSFLFIRGAAFVIYRRAAARVHRRQLIIQASASLARPRCFLFLLRLCRGTVFSERARRRAYFSLSLYDGPRWFFLRERGRKARKEEKATQRISICTRERAGARERERESSSLSVAGGVF